MACALEAWWRLRSALRTAQRVDSEEPAGSQAVKQETGENQRFAVIGGGFIDSEIAAALAMNGKEVVMIFPEEGIGARLFSHDLNQFLNEYYRKKGVEVLPGQLATGLIRQQGRLLLNVKDAKTSSGRTIQVDGVVAGIGIHPNTKLAEQAGRPVDNGIFVDELLCAGNPDVYAAGDVANFYNPALDARLRVEHEDNALTMGKRAGRNIAGESIPYHHLPYFYSDLFELGYEAVGKTNSQLETTADWVEPYHKCEVCYLQDGRVRGVLLWNVWECSVPGNWRGFIPTYLRWDSSRCPALVEEHREPH